MSLLTDYLAKLEQDLLETLALVAGAEDSLDIQAGESTLSPETIARQAEAFADLKARRDWIKAAIALLKDGADKGFDALKFYDVKPEVLAEIKVKQEQMSLFSGLLRPINLGANGGVFTVSDPQPIRKNQKKGA